MEHLLLHKADIKIKYQKRSPLHYAVAENNLEVARMLLEAEADPNEKPEGYDSVLTLAVNEENIDMVSMLLKYGARVDEECSDSWRNTALSRAAGTGKEELVRFIIEKGKADINYCGKDSQPPIYVAAFTRHADIVQILIDHQADVNAGPLNGGNWCALHASYDAPEVAKLLLENGAEIDRECDSGTVLFLASSYNRPDVVKVLLNHKPNPPNLEIQRPDDAGDTAGMTALSIACQKRNLKVMRLLLEAGADPNHLMKDGSSPLKLCLQSPDGADKAVKILLEYAPDLDRRDEEGNTILHDCYRWNRSVARRLVNAGADVRALNKAGQSPLYNAVSNGSTDVVRYLLSKHADPNVQSPSCGSLLYVALGRGLDMIRTLVEGGANVHSAESSPDNKEGLINTVLRYQRNPFDIVKYLIETGGIDINKKRGNLAYPLLTACQRGQADVVRYLLSRGAEPNVVDNLSRRALHLAALSHGSLAALLESNVDVQKFEPAAKSDDETSQQQQQPIRDNMGRTPLHFAASSVDPAAFWRVKNMYPDKAAVEPDDKAWTPLFWALRNKHPVREVVAELLKHGRDVWSRAKGPSGGDWSPLKLARYIGAPEEITKMLVPESAQKGRRGEMWEPHEHVSRVAREHNFVYCDSCFMVSFTRFLIY
jgi:ankyrin repeat protein